MKLKEMLAGKLTEKELSLLPGAFDIIGDIAVFSSFPEELRKKEKIIGQTMLDSFPNLKVIAKKVKDYSGVYRTPKLEIIAGEKRKETIHRENGASFKLDIEKVYFSPRLGEERKRVALLVKPGEEILTMFSGCAPYPVVIAKYSRPKIIYAIEKNPAAHHYAEENIRINHLSNITAIHGDAKEKTEELLGKRTGSEIGLKTSTNNAELKRALLENPRIIEFYLVEKDLLSGYRALDSKIKMLARRGIKVMLHQPHFFRKMRAVLSTEDEQVKKNAFECYSKLIALCRKNKNLLGAIIHPSWNEFKDASEKTFARNFREFSRKEKAFARYAYVENIFYHFFASEEGILKTIEDSGIKNICFDFPHYAIYNKNADAKTQEKELLFIRELRKKCKVYFHIADSTGKRNRGSDTFEVGKGKIDFEKFLPEITQGVLEVADEDPKNPVQEIRSYRRIREMLREKAGFDRIIMPLPKTSEHFLGTCFSAARKGCIVHFYAFMREEEIPKPAVRAIERAAKKYSAKVKILSWNKCGHYSPGKFRVCIDFKVM
jgi:tRNA G37 N-methylase Trm5